MTPPNLDETLVRLEAYEPAGTSVAMTARDLLGHTLVLGGSGAGKTTCIIQPILDQLIRNSGLVSSICILDTKADGESEKFTLQSTFSAEREQDAVIISESSAYCLDLIEPLREEGINGANKLSNLLNYLIPECPVNRYWEATFHSLLNHTIRLSLLLGHELRYEEFVRLIADYLLRFDSDDISFRDIDSLLQAQFETGQIDYEERHIHEARTTHSMWRRLDFRTRSNLQSMALPFVSLLNQQTSINLLNLGNYTGEVSYNKMATFTGVEDSFNSYSATAPSYVVLKPSDFGVVPEPSAFGLLGGFVVLGYVASARRRKEI